MSKAKARLEINEDGDMGYLFFPRHPGRGAFGVAVKQVPLRSLIGSYQGPGMTLDFDEDGGVVGVEFSFV